MLTFILGNLKLKILALGFAAVLWGVVAYSENPTVRQTYTLTITNPNLPQGMVLINDLPTIPVTVTGSAQTLHNFDPRSLLLRVNFSDVHVGLNRIPVQVLSNDPGVTDLEYQSAIAVNVDKIGSVSVSVVIQRLHSLPSGFHEVSGSASVTPAKVTLHGPSALLNGAQAVVPVDLATQTGLIDSSYFVKVLDASGKPIDKVGAAPEQVEVKILVEPDSVTESKAAGAAITGQPAPGYSVTNIQVSPIDVQATGLADVLAGLRQIASDPVDVSNQTSDVIRTVRLRPPAGVQVSPTTVQVHVFITKNPQASPSPGA